MVPAASNLACAGSIFMLAGVALFPGPSYRVIDKVGMPHVLRFIAAELSAFDTSRLDWIKLLPLNRRELLHGACDFPYQDDPGSEHWVHGYRIRASVNIELSPPYTYLHWGRIPSANNKRGWVSGEQEFRFADLEECAVHTLAHECFHFLADSGQIDERNTEANANWWADGCLRRFQHRGGASAGADSGRALAHSSSDK